MLSFNKSQVSYPPSRQPPGGNAPVDPVAPAQPPGPDVGSHATPSAPLTVPPESDPQTTPGEPSAAAPAAKASRGRGRPPGRVAKARKGKGNQTSTGQGSIAHAFERLDRYDDKDGEL
ncbi:uncharacterized protein PG986_004121 [Apiospora aurea]|uniref:Uncharacterized protein n=1 Tax=Apiospora aurea TaxID=335848 RepID=A0ABR1QLP9_9PEZI